MNPNPASRPAIQSAAGAETLEAGFRRISALIRGVEAGKILVHVRAEDDSDPLRWGIYPSAGELLRSTESWRWAEEQHGSGPELTFFSEDFSWALSTFFENSDSRKLDDLQALFVLKNASIIQYVGDGDVQTSSGQRIRYERSVIAVHEDPNFRAVPAGVEPGDWFTNKTQEVLAVVRVVDLRSVLSQQNRLASSDSAASHSPAAEVSPPVPTIAAQRLAAQTSARKEALHGFDSTDPAPKI